jgi:exonuclease III
MTNRNVKNKSMRGHLNPQINSATLDNASPRVSDMQAPVSAQGVLESALQQLNRNEALIQKEVLTFATINLQAKWKENISTLENRMDRFGVDLLLGQDHGVTQYAIGKEHQPVPDRMRYTTNWFGSELGKNRARTLVSVRSIGLEKISQVKSKPASCWMETEISELLDKPLRIFNIYMPADRQTKKSYKDRIISKVTEAIQTGYVIVVGDFNLVRDVNADVRRNYKTAKPYNNVDEKFYERLETLMTDSIEVADDDNNRFTRRGERISRDTLKIVETRLDQVWVDSRLKEQIVTHTVDMHHVESDHGMVVVSVKVREWSSNERAEEYHERTVYKMPAKGTEKHEKLVTAISTNWKDVEGMFENRQGEQEASTLNNLSEAFNKTIWSAVKEHGIKHTIKKDANSVNQTRAKVDRRIEAMKIEKRRLSKGIAMAGKIDEMEEGEPRKKMLQKLVAINDRTSIRNHAELREGLTEGLTEWSYIANNRRNQLNRDMRRIYREVETKEIEKVIQSILEAEDTNRYLFFKRIRMRKGTGIRALSIERDGRTIICTDSERIKQTLVEFWSKVFRSRGVRPNWMPDWLLQSKQPKYKDRMMEKISVEEFRRHFSTMAKDKTPGEDGITVEMLQAMPERMKEGLLKLMNLCIDSREIPNSWKMARISLIFKDGSQYQPGNYRPISLLSVQYKLLTKILASRLSQYMEANQFLSAEQLGYRDGKDTIEGVIRLITKIKAAKAHKKAIHVAYIDLVKAYDSVEHWAIEQALEHYGLDPMFVELIKNVYSEGKADIVTDFGVTEQFQMNSGVRQGDSISPILFIIFLNPLLEMLNTAQTGTGATAYCDDIVITAETKEQIEQQWKKVKEFAEYNNIQVNPDKSGYTTTDTNEATLKMKNSNKQLQKLDPAASYKYLGFWINLELNWTKQQNECEKKLRGTLNVISLKAMSVDQKITLVNIVAHNSIGYRMNAVAFTNTWLEEMDRMIVARIARLAGVQSNKKNDNAIWALRGLNKLVHLQTAIYVSTMVERVLNSNETMADKSMIEVAKVRHLLKGTGCELTDTESNCMDVMKMLKEFDGVSIVSKLIKCGIETNQDLIRDGKLQEYDTLTEAFSEFRHRISRKEWQRVESMVRIFEKEREIEEKVQPHKRIWNQEKLERDRQADKMTVTEGKVCIWTDGSLKDGRAGAAVYLNKGWNMAIRVEGEQSILNGELQAIEWAMVNVPMEWPMLLITDSRNSMTVITEYREAKPHKRRKMHCQSVLNRIEGLLEQREARGGSLEMRHIYSHIRKKLDVARTKGLKEERKWQEKIQAEKDSWGSMFNVAVEGNRRVDDLANSGRWKQLQHAGKWLQGSKRWVITENGEIMDGNILKQIKRMLRRSEREELLKDMSRYKILTSEEIRQEKLDSRFSPQQFRQDRTNNWWFRMITNNLSHPCRTHHKLKNAPGELSLLYADDTCQDCKEEGIEVRDDLTHTMVCPADKEMDEILERKLTRCLNSMTSRKVEAIEVWFPGSQGGRGRFKEFREEWGAKGYLPRDLRKYLAEAGVAEDKIDLCLQRMDNIVKNNRYTRYKQRRIRDSKRRHDKYPAIPRQKWNREHSGCQSTEWRTQKV